MEIPYTVKARPDTGLWNAKIAIWLFLASEVMLFGGLFSAYIFLRVASDTPWPSHVLDVKAGFINTLILIFSSITVLQAWLSLKMRKYGRYQLFMVLTLLSAAIFMVIKANEYNTKFHHYGIKLHDDSIVEGHFKDHGYNIKFGGVTKISLDSKSDQYGLMNWTLTNPGADEKFLSYIDGGGSAQVKNSKGEVINLDKSYIASFVSESRKKAKAEEDKTGRPVSFKEEFTTAQPLNFTIPAKYVVSYTDSSAVLKDGTVLTGKLVDDSMHFIPDLLDLRRLIPSSERNLESAFKTVEASKLWSVVGQANKDLFLKQKAAVLEDLKKTGKEGNLKDADFVRDAFTLKLPHDNHDAIVIKKQDVAFYSNFTPKYHNYYAIYFAITSLHGLHIIGGAIVLAYFLLFDKKIYNKDPEHLANRVEVGGLFWHFVDVVWMIVFPVLYLM